MRTRSNDGKQLGWGGVFRLGLVQAAIGAVVVITTSTLNRVLVVELALPAMLPGILVAIHYFVQVLRPRFGYGSDVGGRRAPWIIGGMAVLGLGAVGATLATVLMATQLWLGIAFAVLAYWRFHDGFTGNLPQVTGAKQSQLLGEIHRPVLSPS